MSDLPTYQSVFQGEYKDVRLEKRRVICAAIFKGGNLILGARHFDMLMHKTIEQIGNGKFPGFAEFMSDAEQGFIDQFGVFMTREEAMVLAVEKMQVLDATHIHNKELYSEDLY